MIIFIIISILFLIFINTYNDDIDNGQDEHHFPFE